VSAPIAILSPHLDDAVLSCWDLLSGQADLLVINVFAGVPPRGSAPGWWDARCGLEDSHAVVRERVAEDRAALGLAGREPVNLDFLDHQYRDRDQPIESIVRVLRGVLAEQALVLAPGALASEPFDPALPVPHPDHLAVRSAALVLASEGFELGLYADLPHASAHGWPAWVLNGVSGVATHPREPDPAAARWSGGLALSGLPADLLLPDVRRLAPAMFARKLEAVRLYASQLAMLKSGFGRGLDDPDLLGYEVTWRMPAAA
jgi:LmbE family N-acetylglucosaminyl deacetylase